MSLRVPVLTNTKPCMSLRVPVLTTTDLVCHSGYQYSSLSVLYVTQGTSTYHYMPCMHTSTYHYMPCMPYLCQTGMSLIVSVRTLSVLYVYQRTSTEIFYSCMPPRVRVSTGVGRSQYCVCVCGGGSLVNLGLLQTMRGCHHVFKNCCGAWPSCTLFLCLCFLICQPCMIHRVPLVASTILVWQYCTFI